MDARHLITHGIVVGLATVAALDPAQAQGLEEARAQLPTFSSTAEQHRAELYIYYPPVDVMVKLKATAAASAFSDQEFGYLMGDFQSIVSEFLARTWWSDYDEASILSSARELESAAKEMKSAFQRPAVTLSIDMDESGVTFAYSGTDAAGGEVSFNRRFTWAQVLAEG